MALEAIQNELKSITRALEANIDKPKSAEEEDRAKGDLRAQQDMAYWAMLMFFTTTVGVALTGVGIFLIYRTLIHTRRAADAAYAMVTEGKNATTAAIAATNEAKRQADFAEQSVKRLERPYLFVKIVQADRLNNRFNDLKPSLDYTVVNYGKTPAIFKSIFLELRPLSELQFIDGRPRIPIGAPKKEWYEVLEQGGSTGKRVLEVLDSSKGQAIDPSSSLAMHGRLTYEDPTKALHTYHFVLLRQDGRFCLEYSRHHSEYPEDREA